MKTCINALGAAVAIICMSGVSQSANAAFVAAVCNDFACTGGDDFVVTDNGAGDTIGGVSGAISFATSAFGYSLLVNTSQSKPLLGSAAAPQLDLTFTATTSSSALSSVYLYASDTNFTGAGSFLLALGGTNSGGSGAVTGQAWGGTTNNALQFSALNQVGSIGPITGTSFSGSASGSFSPTVNPYSLMIGVEISRSAAGTSTGDLNLQIAAVPEPETYALMLAGLGALAFVAKRRKAS